MFEERHLNFNKFLDDRAEQISKFRDILKLDTKKKGHQALPKSIRRRAMSHNRYRIPSKMRKLNEEQLIKSENMQRIPKCRKHIRKISRLILSYKERHSKIKWLSTHLWAAKRMRMIDYYGYKVAQTPNQKAFRSSYRNFMHNCCMIDLSYFQCLTVRFNEESSEIPKNIKIFSQRFGKTQQIMYLNGLDCNRSYEGYLYNKNGVLICPLIILFSIQEQKFVIRCYFNPCCLDQVKNQFVGQFSFSVQIDRCKSQFYCMMGPQWANKINQGLSIYGLDSKIQDFQTLKFNPMQSKLLFSSIQTQKKLQKCPFISGPIPSLIKQKCQNSLTASKIRNQTQKLFRLLSKKKQENQNQINLLDAQKFWSFYDSIKSYSDLINIKVTTRSKYTHKRRNKLTKDQKKKVINLENKKKELISSKQAISEEQQDSASHEMIEESLENIRNEIKEFFIEQKQSKGLNQQIFQGQNQKIQKVNPVLVTSFKKQSLFQGCYIFCSDQDSCRLWRIISKLNVKVIGLQQLRHIRLESQVLSFPENYPETLSFQRYSEKQAQKQFFRLKRRPPSKRTNFIKINSRNPFSLVEKQIFNNHIKVFLQMVSKGRCFSNSYVYQLSTNDITLIEKEMNQKGKIGIVQSQTTKNQMTGGSKLRQKQFIDYIKQNLNSVEEKLSLLKEKRNLVGRVMTGGFMYNKCHQGGIAYVSKSVGLQKQNLKNDGYVLVRKVSSPHYYLAQINEIYPQLSYQ